MHASAARLRHGLYLLRYSRGRTPYTRLGNPTPPHTAVDHHFSRWHMLAPVCSTGLYDGLGMDQPA
jgi:hypothetical protein